MVPTGAGPRKKSIVACGGIGFAKDIVVVTESDVREYGTNPCMMIKNALEEGRELYHATG